ncbi:MAG: family 10 glycosylhydrolase, partial [Planctomycetota bacterium]
SSIEPFAYEYGGDRGFDPLEVACREAHKRGMALHAWVSVMPAWRGEGPPRDSRQLYNAHPEWFWYDQKGRRQPLLQRGKAWYVSLNPCLPEVRSHLVKVFEEIVQKYPVDGLHLDYIRFPSEISPKGSDYPYDRKTLALYKKATGKSPQQDRTRWIRWRTEQVTQLVREIRGMMRRIRPKTKLTAACGADFDRYRRDHFQDGPIWLRGNLVDLVFVMNYCKDVETFRQRQEAWRRAAYGKPVAAGIGMYLHENDQVTIEQLKLAKKWGGGVALFSSNVLFDLSVRSRQRLVSVRSVLPAM